MTADELLTTCERVLALVGTDAEAEVTVSAGSEALTRFATSFIHQNVADDARVVRLRVALDGRVAEATDNRTDDEALSRLVRSAMDAAALQPVDPGWPGLAAAAGTPGVDHWDDATAGAEPDARAERVAAFVRAADGLDTAGFCSTEGVEVAFANSAGQRASGRSTTAMLDGIARTGTSDGADRAASSRLADLDGAAVGAVATRRARESAAATDLEPGRYEVVLSPSCVVNVLSFLAIYGFNGRAVEEGRSFAKVGEAQFDAAVTLADDVAHPMAVGIGFDSEGTPKRRLELVREGVTAGLVHDRRTAKALGAESTGNAVAGAGPFGALPANLVLEPGETSEGELVATMERGLLVTDFWYTRILDPRTMVVTGLTRNGVWLVEDGRIARPVTNLRFTQSYLEALGPGQVRGIGSDHMLVGGATFGFGAYVVPSLHLESWNFTGGARG
jgi:predicted Zn-dependent protease